MLDGEPPGANLERLVNPQRLMDVRHGHKATHQQGGSPFRLRLTPPGSGCAEKDLGRSFESWAMKLSQMT